MKAKTQFNKKVNSSLTLALPCELDNRWYKKANKTHESLKERKTNALVIKPVVL